MPLAAVELDLFCAVRNNRDSPSPRRKLQLHFSSLNASFIDP